MLPFFFSGTSTPTTHLESSTGTATPVSESEVTTSTDHFPPLKSPRNQIEGSASSEASEDITDIKVTEITLLETPILVTDDQGNQPNKSNDPQ